MRGIKMNNYLLIVAALLPAIVLCIYVYKKDRREKEPLHLLLFLFLAGVACCYPASLIESVLIDIIESFFTIHKANDGTLYMAKQAFYIYNFLKYFIGVALVEEFLKWIALVNISKNNKNYNSFFDGMIYAIFVSLGFAALENVMYVIENGWYVAMLRAFLSVPGHMFFAVMMGYHYSLWNIYDKAAQMETELVNQGIIPHVLTPFSSKTSKRNSLIIPVMVHGFYDFCCTINSILAIVVFYSFIIFLYVHCFKKIKQMSSMDTDDITYAKRLIVKKYQNVFSNEYSNNVCVKSMRT